MYLVLRVAMVSSRNMSTLQHNTVTLYSGVSRLRTLTSRSSCPPPCRRRPAPAAPRPAPRPRSPPAPCRRCRAPGPRSPSPSPGGACCAYSHSHNCLLSAMGVYFPCDVCIKIQNTSVTSSMEIPVLKSLAGANLLDIHRDDKDLQ